MGFEPTISAGERPQTYASDRAATGTGTFALIVSANFSSQHTLPGKRDFHLLKIQTRQGLLVRIQLVVQGIIGNLVRADTTRSQRTAERC